VTANPDLLAFLRHKDRKTTEFKPPKLTCRTVWQSGRF